MSAIQRAVLRRLRDQRGTTLIELIMASSLLLIVTGATFAALETTTKVQTRDQAYAEEITATQAALGRLVHDLREATFFQSIAPNAISFQMFANGVTYNVRYDCTASDALGSPYTRCARTQAVAPTAAPAPGTTATSADIQHVWNNANNVPATFCNAGGTGPSGAVFFVSNPNIPNLDGSTAACDEAYQNVVASLNPNYVQVSVQIPASGSLTRGGLKHFTVLNTATFLPILDAGA